MQAFIDCGGYNGRSVNDFMRRYPYKDFQIHTFECFPELWPAYDKITYANFTLHKEAVWINDGVVPFYPAIRNKKASSVNPNKSTKRIAVDIQNPIMSKCIDFSRFISMTFDKKDYLILKMDIEGTEYSVLPKMILDGTLKYFNEIWIDWHWMGITNCPKDQHDSLVRAVIADTGLYPGAWSEWDIYYKAIFPNENTSSFIDSKVNQEAWDKWSRLIHRNDFSENEKTY